MAHYIRVFHRDNTLTCDNIHIFIIIPHETVLEGMENYLITKATRRLMTLGVKIVNHSRITSVEEHTLILNEKEALCFDFMIFTGGIIASTLTADLDVTKNSKSQIIVDKYCRVPFRECVFAAGDIAQLSDTDDVILPSTAQSAEQSGVHAANNIVLLIQNRAMRPSNINMQGMMVALGGNYAAISLFGWIKVSGLAGHIIKTIIMRTYRYILHLQCVKGVEKLPKPKSICSFQKKYFS
jgi:NADH dehydrogenase